MNKNIKLLVEGFFNDEIFNIEDDIKLDIEDIGNQYYNYKVGDIYYLNNEPYAICCGESKYFNDNKSRFCLLKDSVKLLKWRVKNKLVKELDCFKFKYKYFYLWSFNDFKHIDEDGYNNTQIIKNNYDITEFPAFEYCMELGDNVYLPAIDELLMMYLNNDKLGKYSFSGNNYWASTLYSLGYACIIYTLYRNVSSDYKDFNIRVRPFFRLNFS